MTSALSINFRIGASEQFLESVSEPSSSNLYFTYGKVDAWANDSAPDSANTSVATEYEVWKNMIGAKKVTGNDMRHVANRYDWKANNVYIAYDHINPNIVGVDNVQFYVLTSAKHVYKCLANNYGANSTVEPTAINPNTTTQTADGYTWKYMFSVADSDLLKFTTGSYIPVKKITSDDGSLQWSVQSGATEGAIHNIVITNGGSGYTNTNNLIVTISGDGTGAAAYANISASNVVSNVTITNIGAGYSEATVTITGGGGTGATARAIISPIDGHGSNPIYELGASKILLNARLAGTEGGIIPANNEFRQVSIIKEPLVRGTSNVAANSVILQAYKITTAGSGTYTPDEYVYQGATLATASFKGKVLVDNVGEIIIVNTVGTPTSGTLLGANSATARLITSSDDGELQPFSGQLLYIDNIKPITRSSDQTEDFKIVFKF